MQSDYNYVEINGGKGWDTKKGQRKAIGIQKCSQEEKEREKVSGMEPNEMLIKTPRPFNGLEISIMFFIARINLNIFLLALSNS